MSKLRILTERKRDDEIEHVDFDLSGLNNDPLILHSQPYAFVCVKQSNPLIINRVLEIFNLTERKTTFESVLVCKIKSENYKLDILNLLAASFYIHKKDENQKLFVGVARSLMGLLMQSDIVEKNIFKGEELEVDNFDYTKACVTLSQCVQLTLQQAGMNVLTNNQNLSLDKKQVEELFSEFTNKKTKLTRVG